MTVQSTLWGRAPPPSTCPHAHGLPSAVVYPTRRAATHASQLGGAFMCSRVHWHVLEDDRRDSQKEVATVTAPPPSTPER